MARNNSSHLKHHFGTKVSNKLDFKLLVKLFHYIKSHPTVISLALVFMILADISAVLPPYFLKQGLDVSVPNRDLEDLYRNTFYLGFFLLSSFIFSVSFNYSIKLLGQKLILQIRMDIFNKVLSLTSSFFDKHSIGTTLTYLTNDVETLQEFIAEGFITIVGNLVKVLFILIMMFLINPILANFAVLSIPFFLLATLLFKVSLRNAYRGIRKANAVMNTLLIEAITGIKEIILFNHKNKSITRFDQGNSNYLRSFINVVRTYSLYFPVIEFVSFFSTIAVLYGAHRYTEQNFRTGEIFAFFFYISMFFRPLRDLAEKLNTVQSALSSAERIFNFLKINPDFLEKKKKTHSFLPLKSQDIVFDKVYFSYNSSKKVIDRVSFKIKSGEKVAIVGATGSGKTTLIALLNRLYDVDQGRITIGGVNIKDMSFDQLREMIATIPQDVFLFTGNFIENIDLNHLKQESEVILAAKQVGIHSYIKKLKNQYRQNVLEEGKSLSTGQKQLIAFTRAFIKDAPITILDEATANIDSQSEKKIQTSLNQLIKNKTAILIAHRLSTIRNSDRVLVMHHGKLAEQGTHDQLIKKNGIYKKLYLMQSIQSQD